MNEIRTILVDDDPICNEQLRDLLRDYSYIKVVSTIDDPEDVMSKIESEKPHLVFLDIEMPGISGLDLASEIKKIDQEVVIIFVTAFNKYAIQAIKKAAFDYLVKPVDPDELLITQNRLQIQINSGSSLIRRLKAKYPLTPRELEIIDLIRKGSASDEIALKLHLSKFTVDTHRQNILRKTCCVNFSELFGT